MKATFAPIFVIAVLHSAAALPVPGGEFATVGLYPRMDNQADWSSVPADGKFKQSNKLQPQPGQTDTHITYRKKGDPARVTDYQAWKPVNNANAKHPMADAGRWRGEGKSHGGVNPPIYYPAEPGQSKQKARPATAKENPPSHEFAKVSDAIKGKPAVGNKQGSKDDSSVKKPTSAQSPKPKNTSPLGPLPNLGKPVGGREGSKTG